MQKQSLLCRTGLIQATGRQEALQLKSTISLAAAGCVWGHHPLERADDHVFLEGCICPDVRQHHSHQGERQPALLRQEPVVAFESDNGSTQAGQVLTDYLQPLCRTEVLHERPNLLCACLEVCILLSLQQEYSATVAKVHTCCIFWQHEVMLNAAEVVLC